MTPRTTPKKETKYITYDHLDKIGEIAIYYGFIPMKSPVINKTDIENSKELLDSDTIDDETEQHGRLPLHAEEKIALIRMYQEQNMHELAQPVMLYFKDACRGALKGDGCHRYADLEILGQSGSIAEAVLIQTARVMLAEEGYGNTTVEINSVGDRDSLARFIRELTVYYRKRVNEMAPECRELLKKDPIDLLSSQEACAKELNEKAPKSLDFLSENSRRRLEESLEYFDALSVPYTVNNSLFGNRKYCAETVFAIINGDWKSNKDGQKILAIGVRYNNLTKRLNVKRDIQGVGISLLIKGNKENLRKSLSKVKRPVAAFIQLGIESKLASLGIVECLRQLKVPLYLSLAKDRLGAQVSDTEKYHAPYIIVMGKKEAVDRVAIVRKTETHAQETVPLDDLPKYMKKAETEYWGK